MPKNDDLVLVALLFGVLVSLGRRAATQAPGRWVWPMPRLGDGRAPSISDGFHMRPSGMHPAADIMYRRPAPVPGKLPLPDRGSTNYEVPAGTAVMAASDARVWSTGKDAHGWWIVLDHGAAGGGRSTVYRHLEVLAVPAHANGKRADGTAPLRLFAGDVMGTAGFDPTDPRKVRHLHFELRQGKEPFDPAPLMKTWEVLS